MLFFPGGSPGKRADGVSSHRATIESTMKPAFSFSQLVEQYVNVCT